MLECWTTKDQLAQLDNRLLQATRVIRPNPVFIVNFVAALLPVIDVSSSMKTSRLEQTLRL